MNHAGGKPTGATASRLVTAKMTGGYSWITVKARSHSALRERRYAPLAARRAAADRALCEHAFTYTIDHQCDI